MEIRERISAWRQRRAWRRYVDGVAMARLASLLEILSLMRAQERTQEALELVAKGNFALAEEIPGLRGFFCDDCRTGLRQLKYCAQVMLESQALESMTELNTGARKDLQYLTEIWASCIEAQKDWSAEYAIDATSYAPTMKGFLELYHRLTEAELESFAEEDDCSETDE